MMNHRNGEEICPGSRSRTDWSWLKVLMAVTSLLVCETACKRSEGRPSNTTEAQPKPAVAALSPWLEDVTEELGLNFTHDVGSVRSYFMPESLGSGVAIFDFDGDGRMDILLLQNAGTN